MATKDSSNVVTHRTRRNIMKIGAIAVPTTLASVHSAAAGSCAFSIFGVCIIPSPPKGPHDRQLFLERYQDPNG